MYTYYRFCQLRPLTFSRGGLRAIYNSICNNDLRIENLFSSQSFGMSRPVGATGVLPLTRVLTKMARPVGATRVLKFSVN